jgi:nucleosome binding factor SPN SPT16 subunit
MNGKIAAVLLAATMLTTPAFAATGNSHSTPATRTVTPDKVTKTSDKGVKKHRSHARASHRYKVHQAKHAMPNQVKHAKKISKRGLTFSSTKSHAGTVAALHVKAPVKN